MKRISSNMQHTDGNYALRNQESRLHRVNNQIASQRKIQQLRDDPLAAGHSVRYKSYLARLDRFEKNTQTLHDQYKISEGYMQSSLNAMQRLRELAVASANGTLTPDDMKKMAPEVDELLKELVQNGNAVGPDGVRVFSGTKSFTEPFEVVMGDIEGAGSAMIMQVRYNGSIDPKEVETDELSYLDANMAGNKVFWAEKQSLLSETDARNFVVQNDTSIEVDGLSIPLIAGDNVYSIISKINDSGAAVKAYLDPVTNGLNIETTDARQIWLRDGENGNVLSTLGLIKEGQRPPYNLANSVRVSGGSLFDAAIAMRNALLTGDQESLGGKILGSIDSGIDNLSAHMAETGSRYERSEAILARLNTQIPNVTAAEAREADLDLTKAITDLKMFEYTHQATLSTIGNLYKDTLLNYLR
ncbi:flagellar hook-associated protein 3 [Treponema phagedenis]|uniref:Flagellar hook-associated protein 3 n=1 Tax=Treponema phagedenis TaxID=162 RepID=A0A0B7GSI8_TREPH|nr:flagellar hook-associated protein 3 [Treponema phagedenis]QSH99311.1 flagellar hook-associated protein 3 [Treponema phagedenis]CEM61569.1 Flagellar hook-associated protein 3 [Treponema phagedenis]